MPTHLTLPYGKQPIRAVLDHHGLWYVASDLYRANRRFTDRGCLSRIDPTHLRLHDFATEAGSIRLTCVTPAGALTIARWIAPKVDRILDAWVRRETNLIAEKHGLPPLLMELLPDHSLPARPRVSHEHYAPWKALERDHRGYRLPSNRNLPALRDEDTNLSPHDQPDAPAPFNYLLKSSLAAPEDVAA